MCSATVWKGPKDRLKDIAAKAACKLKDADHVIHVDGNGVRFTGTGADAVVLVIRGGQEVAA